MARGTRNDERCRRFCDKHAAPLRPFGLVRMGFPSYVRHAFHQRLRLLLSVSSPPPGDASRSLSS
jgi:hypothetical protein